MIQGGSDLIHRGTPAFRQTNLALFAAGFSTFALMYCVQPLMPAFSRSFGIGAAAASLSLSVTTGFLALAMLFAGAISEVIGRKSVMTASLFGAALLTVLSSIAPAWPSFLVVRSLEGIAFSGLPAVAMAYLSEEIDPRSLGLAMGLYISGTALGGMSGRLIVGVITDLSSWRAALAAIGTVGIIAALVFWWSLPPSRHFERRSFHVRPLAQSYLQHLGEPGLRLLFVEGGLAMGSFVTAFNYIAYRLMVAPYQLSQSAVGLIFTIYIVGIFSSAWVGELASRLGRRKVLWTNIALMLAGVLVTLPTPLWAVITGLAVFTFGFFGAHSVLSSWIGLRAQHARAQASSLYLLFYYLGSSAAGTAGGAFWNSHRWNGVAAFVCCLLFIALAISIRLARLQPIASTSVLSSPAVSPVP